MYVCVCVYSFTTLLSLYWYSSCLWCLWGSRWTMTRSLPSPYLNAKYICVVFFSFVHPSHAFFFFFFFSSASIGLHALCLASITTVSSHLKKQNNSPANSHKCGNRHKWWIHWRSEWEELKEWFVICIALQLIWFITGLGTFNDIKSMPLCGTF